MAINIPESPCFGCKERRAACHAECLKGQEYTELLKARNREIKAERDKDTRFNAYKVDRIFETKKLAPGMKLQRKMNEV